MENNTPLADSPLPPWRQVLALAWPVLAQQVLVLAVDLSDLYLTGHFEPGRPEEHIAYQAAQTTAGYLSWAILSYTVLVSIGSTVLVARFVGAGDYVLARRVVHQSLLLASLLGISGTVVGLALLEPILWSMQLRGDAVVFAAAYLRPLLSLLIFQIVQSAAIACLAGAGDTRTGLWVRGGVAAINLPLAWLLFHGWGPVPALGFAGIALGTGLSYTFGSVAVLAVLVRGRAGLHLSWQSLRPDWPLLARLLRVSVPAALDSFSVVVGQLWFLGIVNRLGDTAASAHGVAVRCEALGYLSGHAFGTAAMTLVGQNLGAKRQTAAAHVGWLSFRLGCGVMSLMGLVFFVLAPPLFGLFCPNPEQQPVVEAGIPVLRLVAFAMPFLASCIVFTAALRGAGDTRGPLLFTWVGFLGVRIPLAYLLAYRCHLALFGAWLAMFADLVVRGLFFYWRFLRGRWQMIRV